MGAPLTCSVGFNISTPGRFYRGRGNITIMQPGFSFVLHGELQHVALMENLLLTWGWVKVDSREG